MGPQQKHLARTLFQNRVLKSDGFEFENLFGNTLSYSRPNFKKIEPYGNHGDRGNDGYEPNAGRYFQVYAPKNPASSKSAAIEKAANDFGSKLIPHWTAVCEPKEYYFVFNDKYKGSIVDIEKTLSALKTKYSLAVCDTYLNKQLEQEFIELPEDQLSMIVGGLPNWNSITHLDYSVLGEIIRFIQNNPAQYKPTGKYITPLFEEKIIFNCLNENGAWLTAKSRESWQVDEFLNRNSSFAKQEIRDILAGYYAESVANIPNQLTQSAISTGDLRFGYILEKIAPPTNNHALDRLRKDSALVLMSKYFETCDIFEEPNNVTS